MAELNKKTLVLSKNRIKDNRVFNIVNLVVLTLFTLIVAVPLWNVLVSSFSDSAALSAGKVSFWPIDFTLENYKAVLRDTSIWQAFGISVAKTVFGVVTHVLFTSMVAYGMSKRNLMGRKAYIAIGMVTMFFGGGMVPTYLLYRQMGLLDNFLVFIIPSLFSFYDMIILMNFFRNVSPSLEESARIDGAGTWQIFFKIIMPLSKPVLATIALYNGVYQWNDYMTTKMFINNQNLYPVQMKLYEIIVQSQMSSMTDTSIGAVLPTTTKSIQLATIVITALPIVIVYPFLQKYFVTGITLGAVKE